MRHRASITCGCAAMARTSPHRRRASPLRYSDVCANTSDLCPRFPEGASGRSLDFPRIKSLHLRTTSSASYIAVHTAAAILPRPQYSRATSHHIEVMLAVYAYRNGAMTAVQSGSAVCRLRVCCAVIDAPIWPGGRLLPMFAVLHKTLRAMPSPVGAASCGNNALYYLHH